MTFINKFKRKIKYSCYLIIEKLFFVSTGNWKKFYGWYLDRQDKKKDAKSLIELGKVKYAAGEDKGLYDTSMGAYHLEFLRSVGLKPEHKIFELGFGFGRAAIPMIKFLNCANYAGSEISKERLRITKEWIQIEKLKRQKPKLVLSLDNKFEFLENGWADFIWAQSVFTHLPEKEILTILTNLRCKINTKGKIIFNYTLANEKTVERTSIKDFSYSEKTMKNMCESLGYSVEILQNWQNNLKPEFRASHNQMLKLQLK